MNPYEGVFYLKINEDQCAIKHKDSEEKLDISEQKLRELGFVITDDKFLL